VLGRRMPSLASHRRQCVLRTRMPRLTAAMGLRVAWVVEDADVAGVLAAGVVVSDMGAAVVVATGGVDPAGRGLSTCELHCSSRA
jgi:hypothetical protein